MLIIYNFSFLFFLPNRISNGILNSPEYVANGASVPEAKIKL
jgi:hypothetical protein